MKKYRKTAAEQSDERLQAITRPGPAAALRRQLALVKRQPGSLARALGDAHSVTSTPRRKIA